MATDKSSEGFPVPEDRKELLFVIQRNKNHNTVVYDAKLDKDGKLNKKDPVDVYWIMYATDSSKEGLNFIERKSAYGISVDNASPDEALISLKAFKQRKVTIRFDDEGNPIAVMEIDGKPARLKRIFVKAKETGMLPKVEHVDLEGTSLDGDGEVFERVHP